MEINKPVSRRNFVKGGALVVSFSFFGRALNTLAQSEGFAGAEPQANALDSWLSIAQDGTVTVYTSKVDLGTGVVTALSQIVAEELDVPFHQIHMETGDTSQTIDQAATVGSRTVDRGGTQLRQAAAAARAELLRLASSSLEAPATELLVTDGVVSVKSEPTKKNLLREFDRRPPLQLEDRRHRHRHADGRSAGRKSERPQGLQNCRHLRAARGPASEIHRRVHIHTGCAHTRDVAWTRRAAAGRYLEARERR